MGNPRIASLAFLTPGNFADDDPYTGLEETLGLFEYGHAGPGLGVVMTSASRSVGRSMPPARHG